MIKVPKPIPNGEALCGVMDEAIKAALDQHLAPALLPMRPLLTDNRDTFIYESFWTVGKDLGFDKNYTVDITITLRAGK